VKNHLRSNSGWVFRGYLCNYCSSASTRSHSPLLS